MNGRYVRFNTPGTQYTCAATDYERLERAVLSNEPGPRWIELHSPCGEKEPFWINAAKVEAFWLSTPEDRLLYHAFARGDSEEANSDKGEWEDK